MGTQERHQKGGGATQTHANGTPCHIQHSPNTPTTGLRERGNDTSKSTGRSGQQNAATRRNMRREERVPVQGPVKEQQPDGMSHRGAVRHHNGTTAVTPSCGPGRVTGSAVAAALISSRSERSSWGARGNVTEDFFLLISLRRHCAAHAQGLHPRLRPTARGTPCTAQGGGAKQEGGLAQPSGVLLTNLCTGV